MPDRIGRVGRVGRVAALIAVATIVVGACTGSSAASSKPTAKSTAAPTATSAPNVSATPVPSTPHMAQALEDMLPDTFNGEPMKKQSFDGTALGADIASRSMLAFLAAHSSKLTDFTEAGASDPRDPGALTFEAFHLTGVDDQALLAALIDATRAAAPTLAVTTVTVGGRTVMKAVDAHGIRYIYAKNGYVYGVQASTQDLADGALALLP